MDDARNELIGLEGRSPRSERGDLLFDLDETAALLVLEQDDLDDVWLRQPARYVAVGFMLRCQRLIRGMVSLIRAGLLDSAVVLVRPTIECAVTGMWLLETDKEGLSQLMGFDRKEMRRFIASVTGEKPKTGFFDYGMKFWFDEAEDRELVPVRVRAGRLFPWLQKIHFEAHSWVHATVRASYLAFEMDDIDKDPERREWSGLLPRDLQEDLRSAAIISLIHGREVHRCFEWDSDDFDEVLEGLGADEELLALFD